MEPERPIEKLLRAWARKRRDESGAPFELHPATRHWLQGEVARRFGRAQRAPRRFDRWFWPKLVWGLGAVTVLAMTLALLVPSLHRRPAEMALAERKARLESAPARRAVAPASESPAPAEPYVLADAQSKALPVDKLSNKPSPAAVPPASAPAAPVVAQAPPPRSVTNHLFFKGQLAQSVGGRMDSGAVQFARVHSEAEAQAARRKQVAPTAAVLVSFQFEQSGRDVRIIDKDGSVYTGALLAADFADRPALKDGSKPTAGGAQGVAQEKLAPTAPAGQPSASSVQQIAPDYCFFRVAGTNRTLNQNVVFSGKLLGAAGVAGLTNAWSGIANRLGAALSPPAQAGSTPLFPSQIVGQAAIGPSQPIQINAVPVP